MKFPKLKSILMFVPSIFSAIKLVKVIDDVKKLITKTIEAIEKTKAFMDKLKGVAKQQFVEILKEWDGVLETLADICAKIPYFKKHEAKIRGLIETSDYK